MTTPAPEPPLDDLVTVTGPVSAYTAAAGDTLQLKIWNAYDSGATACTFARMTVVRLGA